MKTKYRLKNLDCANCALKIEDHLKKQSFVKDASINFATLTLSINTSDIESVKAEISKVEPSVQIEPFDTVNPIAEPEKISLLKLPKQIIAASVSAILLLILILFEKTFHQHNLFILEYAITIGAYLLSGWNVLREAFRTIRDKQWFNEHVLMTVATLGALSIHAIEEAVGVMIFYQIGEFLQSLAVNRSRRSIRALMQIRPEFANLKVDNKITQVSPETVKPDDIIIIKPGEKIPLDGIILDGNSSVNTSVLTGESVPKNVNVNDMVLSGEINMTGLLTVKVTKLFSESSVVKILDLVENAAEKKTKTEQFMTRFARYYTPFVAIMALFIAVIPPLLISGQHFNTWIYRALVLLVISCPCALVVSIPLGYFGGIGGASRRGILIKGSNFIDVLSKVKSVVFDKTGTLTKGVFKVQQVVSSNGYSASEILHFAALAESHSNHHIARSVLQAYSETNGVLDTGTISEHQEISGYGVIARHSDKTIIAGNDALLHRENIEHTLCNVEGTVIHVAVNRKYAGYIVIGDQLKEDARIGIDNLRKEGIDDISMLTGDNEHAAEEVAQRLNLDSYYAGLLPEQKVQFFENIVKQKRHQGAVAFVGDGINDSPVLARADVGIAMGALGSEAAIESADVVLMTDQPSRIAEAIHIGKQTKAIIFQNIVFALGVKLLFVALGSIGLATMWEAVFADMGVTIIAILNSVRTLHYS